MSSNRIDVHHHFVPDFYREALAAAGGDPSGSHWPTWSESSDKVIREQFGINTVILSLTAPGVCVVKDPVESAALARRANEYAAGLRDQNPTHYGFFASLPSLLEKELVFKELSYAFDTLKADGVILFTRYGPDNHYLGHPDFQDIWAELNRRGAVVLVHPTHPVDTGLVSGVPQPIIRYPFETTTTALDMILNKTVRNNPNCKIILSHAGGALPYLVGRPASVYGETEEAMDEFLDDARSFYFDTALSGTWNVLRILEKFAKPGHILYGSDFPFANSKILDFHTNGMDQYSFEDREMINQINRENALALFPRLA